MDQHLLQLLVDDHKSIRQIASVTDKSPTAVRHWLNKFGITTAPVRPYRCSCGETDPLKFYGTKKSVCGRCHNAYTIQVGHEKRDFAIQLLGSRCSNPQCGYDKYRCALDVHHIDPKAKDPNFASMRGWSNERIVKELKHCCLLCKCCHAAVHAGELTIDGV